MTDLHEDTGLHENTGPHENAATRRALLGIGGAAVLATIGGEVLAPAAAAQAAPAASTALATRPRVTPRSQQGAAKLIVGRGPADRDQSSAATTATTVASVPVGQQYPTYAAAIAAATPPASTLFDVKDHNLHLLRRATFGPRPSDIRDLKSQGITKWLDHQLSPKTIEDTGGAAVWKSFPLAGASASTINAKTDQFSWDAMLATAQAVLGMQMFSKRQLFEVVADVMGAHLHVAVPAEQWNTSPGYIKNVIRKYAFGKYRTMLLAAMKHPAMLNFLSNDESTKEHVNENLGRELLELHTVGVNAGYTEDDVKSSAKILSGRTIDWQKGTYHYDRNRHWVGKVKVLGFESDNASGGEAVGDAYLTYLAMHPKTAQNIARKLAVRFVSDQPSADLVQRLADVYLAHDTSIVAVVKAIFLSSDFWSAVGVRMRRPLEDTVGTFRVLNVGRPSTAKKTVSAVSGIYWNLWNQNNAPLGWNPPNGYPDVAAAWLGAGSMLDRWNGHRNFVNGWWPREFKYTKPQDLVKFTAKTTAGQWVDLVSARLLGLKLNDTHRSAVIVALGLAESDLISKRTWMLGEGISLILDSAYFQLR